jgi:hypothetical protein
MVAKRKYGTVRSTKMKIELRKPAAGLAVHRLCRPAYACYCLPLSVFVRVRPFLPARSLVVPSTSTQ